MSSGSSEKLETPKLVKLIREVAAGKTPAEAAITLIKSTNDINAREVEADDPNDIFADVEIESDFFISGAGHAVAKDFGDGATALRVAVQELNPDTFEHRDIVISLAKHPKIDFRQLQKGKPKFLKLVSGVKKRRIDKDIANIAEAVSKLEAIQKPASRNFADKKGVLVVRERGRLFPSEDVSKIMGGRFEYLGMPDSLIAEMVVLRLLSGKKKWNKDKNLTQAIKEGMIEKCTGKKGNRNPDFQHLTKQDLVAKKSSRRSMPEFSTEQAQLGIRELQKRKAKKKKEDALPKKTSRKRSKNAPKRFSIDKKTGAITMASSSSMVAIDKDNNWILKSGRGGFNPDVPTKLLMKKILDKTDALLEQAKGSKGKRDAVGDLLQEVIEESEMNDAIEKQAKAFLKEVVSLKVENAKASQTVWEWITNLFTKSSTARKEHLTILKSDSKQKADTQHGVRAPKRVKGHQKADMYEKQGSWVDTTQGRGQSRGRRS